MYIRAFSNKKTIDVLDSHDLHDFTRTEYKVEGVISIVQSSTIYTVGVGVYGGGGGGAGDKKACCSCVSIGVCGLQERGLGKCDESTSN